MDLQTVFSNIQQIRDNLKDLPKQVDHSFEQDLLYWDTQLSVCSDFLAEAVEDARYQRELKEGSHKDYVNKRMIELMESDPVKYKTVAKCEATARSEDGYQSVIESRAKTIAHHDHIKARIDSVKNMQNAIARNLKDLNTEKIKFGGND